MITPTKKRIVYKEVADLFAKEGASNIPDIKTLLTYNITSCNNITTFKKVFKNWGTMVSILNKVHPNEMEQAESKPAPKATPKPKAAIKPKAEAKPAAKSAVKKGK